MVKGKKSSWLYAAISKSYVAKEWLPDTTVNEIDDPAFHAPIKEHDTETRPLSKHKKSCLFRASFVFLLLITIAAVTIWLCPVVIGFCQDRDYRTAVTAFENDDYYAAWKIFSNLENFNDSEQRAQSCIMPYPATSALYSDGGFFSTASENNCMVIFATLSTTEPVYFKIYYATDGTLASTYFVNVGTNLMVFLPEGNYIIKAATGSRWFGDEDMFGDEGRYATLTSSGSDSGYLTIQSYRTIAFGSDNLFVQEINREEF